MAWLTDWAYRKEIPIAGQAGAGTDYQIQLEVHPGIGADAAGVVYLNNHGRIDLGDVRFTTDDGETLLDYWLQRVEHAYSDVALAIEGSVRLSNGNILARKAGTAEIHESVNDGLTFNYLATLPGITNFVGGRMFVDSGGRVFISVGGKVFRSVDSGSSWTAVHTLSGVGGWERLFLWDFCEDNSGNLYGGKYEWPVAVTGEVLRSVDNGANWAVHYTSGNFRHMHGVGHNTFNDYVYVCWEARVAPPGASGISRWNGVAWAVVFTGIQFTTVIQRGDDNDMYFGRDGQQDSIIYRTTDAGGGAITLSVFVDLGNDGYISDLRKFADGNLLVATVNNVPGAGTSALFVSTDTDWQTFTTVRTIAVTGWEGFELVMTGSIDVFCLVTRSDGTDNKVVCDEGLFWIEVAANLDAGQTVYIYYGKSDESSASNIFNTGIVPSDDFNDDALDAAKWVTVLQGGDSCQEVRQQIVDICPHNADWHHARLRSQNTLTSASRRFIAKSAYLTAIGDQHLEQHYSNADLSTHYWDWIVSIANSEKAYLYSLIGAVRAQRWASTNIVGVWNYKLYEILRTATQVKLIVRNPDGSIWEQSGWFDCDAGTTYLHAVCVARGGTNAQARMGYLFITKYVSPEPVVGIPGGEEGGRMPRAPAYGLDPMIF